MIILYNLQYFFGVMNYTIFFVSNSKKRGGGKAKLNLN